MGQYYHVITEDRNGKREYFNIQTADWKRNKEDFSLYHGVKLMEHSWLGNHFTNAFAEMLVDNPKKVCWCGDYAEPDECEALGFKKTEIWEKEDDDYVYPEPTEFDLEEPASVRYLINNTKKTYVDLLEYKRKYDCNEWIPFPVSLLTALGNGRGGGDYNRDSPCSELVGEWAFDEIYLSDKLPKGYEKLDVYFSD